MIIYGTRPIILIAVINAIFYAPGRMASFLQQRCFGFFEKITFGFFQSCLAA